MLEFKYLHPWLDKLNPYFCHEKLMIKLFLLGYSVFFLMPSMTQSILKLVMQNIRSNIATHLLGIPSGNQTWWWNIHENSRTNWRFIAGKIIKVYKWILRSYQADVIFSLCLTVSFSLLGMGHGDTDWVYHMVVFKVQFSSLVVPSLSFANSSGI